MYEQAYLNEWEPTREFHPVINNMILTKAEMMTSTVTLPVGAASAAATTDGLALLEIDANKRGASTKLVKRLGTAMLTPCNMDNLWRQLADYFKGHLRGFDLDLDFTLTSPFQRRVLFELKKVPYGETVTYGELAANIGRPQAARAVGRALQKNPLPIIVPCHRVVGADGTLTGYAGGLDWKKLLLDLEGVGKHFTAATSSV